MTYFVSVFKSSMSPLSIFLSVFFTLLFSCLFFLVFSTHISFIISLALPLYTNNNFVPPPPPPYPLLFQVGGAAVLGVGVWTVLEKSDYLSLLASSTFAVSAYILILAGGLVVVTGFLGCCAVIREQRSCLSTVRW